MKLHRCKRTVAQWHGEFIRCVAKYFWANIKLYILLKIMQL